MKAAIIWNNRVHPEQEKKVDYTQGRYPAGLSQILMVNPFYVEKKTKKKKKKWDEIWVELEYSLIELDGIVKR